MITTHSEKGLATIADMDTKAEDWGLTPIKWEKKKYPTVVWVHCPKCDGEGKLWSYKGKVLNNKGMQAQKEIGQYSTSYSFKSFGAVEQECDCPWQKPTRSGREYFYEFTSEEGKEYQGFRTSYRERGLVKETRLVERTVGTVLWAKGTIFDSRFGDNEKNKNYSADSCQLCAKRIPSQRFVPVNGKDSEGYIHGMWVGEDCARKFFGVKAFKPEQVIVREGK